MDLEQPARAVALAVIGKRFAYGHLSGRLNVRLLVAALPGVVRGWCHAQHAERSYKLDSRRLRPRALFSLLGVVYAACKSHLPGWAVPLKDLIPAAWRFASRKIHF